MELCPPYKLHVYLVKTCNLITSLCLIAAISQVTLGSISPLSARPLPKTQILASIASLPQGPFIVEMQDGKEFIESMCQAADNLNDYSFQFEMTVYKLNGEQKEAGNFYFKKPRLIRLEETGNFKKGAVAVLQRDGKVRAHLGGALGFFVVTLTPESDYLRSANEYPLVASDFISLAQFLKNWLKEGMISRVTEKPVLLNGYINKVHVIEMYKQNNPHEVHKRVFVDEITKLPVQWYDFRDGRLWSKSLFKNVKTNTGLEDTLFNIKDH